MKTTGYKKKAFKKKRVNLKKPKVTQSVKQYVKRQIHTNLENKYHCVFQYNQAVGSPYIIMLTPPVNQGNNSSQRTGNMIRMMSSKLVFFLSNSPYNLTTNPSGPVVYRWFLLSQRKDNSSTFTAGSFWEINNSSTNIQYTLLDQVYDPNPALYKVHKQGRITLGVTANSTSFPSANIIFDNSKVSITKTLGLTKYHHKKIKFDDGGTVPCNYNLWFVIIPNYVNGSSISGYSPGNISYCVHHHYEDA